METEYSETIKKLVQQYYRQEISVGEYRAKRKLIIDHMDQDFNGRAFISDDATLASNNRPQSE